MKEKLHFSVYYLALGHLAVDWAQGAIPALLPFFIQTYHWVMRRRRSSSS